MDNVREATSNATRTIDAAHAAVHDGKHFVAHDFALSVALGATVVYVLVTDGNTHHFNWEVSSDGGVKVDIYEDVTTSNNGTSVPVFNRNRASANTSHMTAFKTPSGLSGGTQIYGTGSTSKSGSLQASISEFILKPNTKYSFVLTAYTNNVNIATTLDWYELGN